MKLSVLSLGVFTAISGIGQAAPASDYYLCANAIVTKLISLYQTGQVAENYAQCEKDNSGYGYSSGIINFSTSNGDALRVIQLYKDEPEYKDEFEEYISILKQYAEDEDGSTAELDGYCDAWEAAAENSKFMDAQDAVLKEYEDSTTVYINDIGIRLTISRAVFYDTVISEGLGEDKSSFGGMFNATNAKFDSDESGSSSNSVTVNGKYKVDELVWLQKFLDVRESQSKSGNTEGIEAYRSIIERNDLDWNSGVTVAGPDGEDVLITC